MSGICGVDKPSGDPYLTTSGGGGEVGTVTSVGTGTGLTGGPITTSGTISVANSTANTLAGYNNSGVFSDITLGSGISLVSGVLSASGSGGSGTVTNVATGVGLTGGPITGSGTISMANKAANSLAGYDNGGVFVDVTVGSGLYLSGNILSASGGGGAVSSVFGRTGVVVAVTNDYSEAQISFTDITTNNVSITKHGYVPNVPNDATRYLDGTGNFSVPSVTGGGSGGISVSHYLTPSTITPPTYTTWAYHVNATYSTNSAGAYVITTYSSANPEIMGTTALSGNYDIIGCFSMNPSVVGGKQRSFAISIWDTGSGKMVSLELDVPAGNNNSTLYVKHYPSFTGTPSTAFSIQAPSFSNPLWLRINCSSTTYTFYISVDGQSWDQIYTESTTAYMTTAANSGGFGFYDSATTAASAGHLVVPHFVKS